MAASLLLPVTAPVSDLPILAYVAGLAASDAILALLPPERRGRVEVKWPNDVLLDRRKLAGILIEHRQAGARRAAIIGIGINRLAHPAGTLHPATDLAAAGLAVGFEDLFTLLAEAMDRRLHQWSEGAGRAAVLADWQERAHAIGAPLVVRLPGRELGGRFDGLDPTGALVLRQADGHRVSISAGDVFAGADMTEGLPS